MRNSYYCSAAMVMVLLAGCAVKPPEPTAEQKKIMAQLAEINTKLDKMEKKLALFNRGGSSRSSVNIHPGTVRVDPAILAKIVLPPKPDKEALRSYVTAIIDATQGQTHFAPDDLQVKMLQKIGPENVDIMVDELDKCTAGGRHKFHLIYAINAMAGPKNKDAVIKAFAQTPELVDAICRNGWAKDVKDDLVNGLRYSNGYLSSNYVKAVAGLKDPSTYDVLKEYLVRCPHDRYGTYMAIRDLPGMKIDDAQIRDIWKQIKVSNNQWQKNSFAPVAMASGEIDALEIVINRVAKGDAAGELLEAVCNCTEYQGMPLEIKAQFEKDKKNLYFDEKLKKFILKTPPAVEKK